MGQIRGLQCSVKKCKNKALVLYGSNWICGNCLIKLMDIEKIRKNKMVEELEI